MTVGRLVEAHVHYACGCMTHHAMILEKHLALYVQQCHHHRDGSVGGRGWRVRVEKLRVIPFEEEMRRLQTAAIEMGSVYDAQFEDQETESA